MRKCHIVGWRTGRITRVAFDNYCLPLEGNKITHFGKINIKSCFLVCTNIIMVKIKINRFHDMARIF